MNIPKQMINLLGAVVVIAVLVAGVTLAGLPLYSNAQATDASTRTVEQTNEIYEIQVAQLSAKNERIDEIDADLASLEEEIPGLPRLDDVVEIVVAAAGTVEGTIQSIEAADLEVWTPRSGLDSDDGDDTAPTDGEATDEAATGEEASADATDAAAQDTATEAPADDAPAAEDSPQKQIPVTIEIAVPDAAAAAAFMDELGRGPRLIAPIDGTLEDGVLRVTALAFLRTGD